MTAITEMQRDLQDFNYLGFSNGSHIFQNPITGEEVFVANDNTEGE